VEAEVEGGASAAAFYEVVDEGVSFFLSFFLCVVITVTMRRNASVHACIHRNNAALLSRGKGKKKKVCMKRRLV